MGCARPEVDRQSVPSLFCVLGYATLLLDAVRKATERDGGMGTKAPTRHSPASCQALRRSCRPGKKNKIRTKSAIVSPCRAFAAGEAEPLCSGRGSDTKAEAFGPRDWGSFWHKDFSVWRGSNTVFGAGRQNLRRMMEWDIMVFGPQLLVQDAGMRLSPSLSLVWGGGLPMPIGTSAATVGLRCTCRLLDSHANVVTRQEGKVDEGAARVLEVRQCCLMMETLPALPISVQ